MANLSPGGNRAYTLTDIIGILNQDIQNLGATDLGLDTAFTLFADAQELCIMVERAVSTVVVAEPTWGSGSVGLVQWN